MTPLALHESGSEICRQTSNGLSGRAPDLLGIRLHNAVLAGQRPAELRRLASLPPPELAGRPRLQLAAAWSLALSEAHPHAISLLREIPEDADCNLRLEATLVASGAAYFADDPDRYFALLEPWHDAAPSNDPRLARMFANRRAAAGLWDGDPAATRCQLREAGHLPIAARYRHGIRWGQLLNGLAYVWEGQPVLAVDLLRPALEKCAAELGRGHALSCMLAAVLASALYDGGSYDEAAALLAGRLPMLERYGLADCLLLAYLTSARLARREGADHRVAALYESLYTIGIVRNLPRLSLAGLAELVRLHAIGERLETCRGLLNRTRKLFSEAGAQLGPRWRALSTPLLGKAEAYVAFASGNWGDALVILSDLQQLAENRRLGRLRIEILALRALAYRQLGSGGSQLLCEANGLGRLFGLEQVVAETHPDLARWIKQLDFGVEPVDKPIGEAPVSPATLMGLSPRQFQVLSLLANKLSNKEIARVMEIGEETVKWHLKQVFAKLDAGNRKHAIRQAQSIGLLN